MQTDDRISLLDARLANQIAAGEVVERPASVVKELVENSIDAGATRIEVDIERGGIRLIRITDNGKGIHKDDLPLALTRHATSKIHTTDDLANIQSLGFRGEALASISSVSRLTLTSRTADNELAWQAMAQGRDMAVDIQPAAASPGTRVEIADLFFNTPARQKFLRTEKTEFSHVEEVFKRHALANFAIAFVLKHNHKIIKRVPACGESSQRLKRIATICGKPFAENSIPFECNHEAMRLWGWLGRPDFHRSESDIQYVFINGRPVKDKTLNHAVRQAYDGLLPPGRMATYVIYLEVDPRQVDVNVHPTKHEVRFSEQRLVHDLLAKSIADALSELADTRRLLPDDQYEQDYPKSTMVSGKAETATRIIHESMPVHSANLPTPDRLPAARPAYAGIAQGSRPAPFHNAAVSTAPAAQTQVAGVAQTTKSNASGVRILSLGENYFITQLEQRVGVLKADRLLCEFIQQLITEKLAARRKALLFPQCLTLPVNLLEDYKSHDLLEKLGFELQPDSGDQIIIRQIPTWAMSLGKDRIAALIPDWLAAWSEQNLSAEKLAELICTAFTEIPTSLVEHLVAQIPLDPDCHGAVKQLTPDQVAGLFQ